MKLTQKEVFDFLVTEMSMRYALSNMYPTGWPVEKCRRQAINYAVQNTWYWYNNQDVFKNHALFSLKSNKF